MLEVRDADGQGLVDSQSMTLYAFDGALKQGAMRFEKAAHGISSSRLAVVLAAVSEPIRFAFGRRAALTPLSCVAY